jgi:DNA polymerase III subunit epsilon
MSHAKAECGPRGPWPNDNRARMETVAVIDFETTGASPGQGARATEIAAVLVEGGEIVGRFQSLMNTGAWVPPFIEHLTGITNAMLHAAPPARAVMHELARFTKGYPLVAHNAAFDRGFWHAEMARAECAPDAAHTFACTVLLSRRLYPHAENHRLATLSKLHALPNTGRAHRALADAEVTAHLWLRMQRDVEERYADVLGGAVVTHSLLCDIQRMPRHRIADGVAGSGRVPIRSTRPPREGELPASAIASSRAR